MALFSFKSRLTKLKQEVVVGEENHEICTLYTGSHSKVIFIFRQSFFFSHFRGSFTRSTERLPSTQATVSRPKLGAGLSAVCGFDLHEPRLYSEDKRNRKIPASLKFAKRVKQYNEFGCKKLNSNLFRMKVSHCLRHEDGN